MSSMPTAQLPNVPMAMLTSLPLTSAHWAAIAANASWQTLRMNLNTFERHGVFASADAVRAAAAKLRDAREIRHARALPYQLLVAYTTATSAPLEIREALQDALETATANVPALASASGGKVWVLVDISGSMHSPVTGTRNGSTTQVRCIDVAALIAASVVRKNPAAGVLPFSDAVHETDLNPRDSVMTNAQRLASLPSGGTNCSAPLRWLNERRERGELVLLVSDNESWMDTRRCAGPTQTLIEWERFKRINPSARLVCLDLLPNTHSQAPDREDVLNIGGFSDAVFETIAAFASGPIGKNSKHWIDEIRRIAI
jgi:60 kDa SS-A/Ro ribonucleoprotein